MDATQPRAEVATLAVNPVPIVAGGLVAGGQICVLHQGRHEVSVYRDGRLMMQRSSPAPVHALLSDPRQRELVLLCPDGVRILDADDGTLRHVGCEVGDTVHGCAVNGNVSAVAFARPRRNQTGSSVHLLLLDQQRCHDLAWGLLRWGRVQALAFSADSRTLAVLFQPGYRPTLADLTTGETHQISFDHLYGPVDLAETYDGRWAVADKDRVILLRDPTRPTRTRGASYTAIEVGRPIEAFAVAWDGSMLAAGCVGPDGHPASGAEVRIRGTGGGKLPLDVPTPHGRVIHVAFDAEGSVVGFSSDGTVLRIRT